MKTTHLISLLIATTLLAMTQTTNANFLSENSKLGGLEDTLRFESRANLIKMALACEKFDLEKRQIKVLGGLDDYIESLEDMDIMKIIFVYAQTYREDLNDLQKLKTLAKITDSTPTDVDKYLTSLSRQDLVETALSLESDVRKKKGITVIGGLHDYIDSLSNEEIIAVVKRLAEEYKMDTIEKLKALIEKKSLSDAELLTKLQSFDANTLLHVALAVDSYDYERGMYKRMGGLHDYAFRLSKEDLIKAVLPFFEKWPELKKEEKIDQLLVRDANRLGGAPFGGIEDYLFKFSKEDLIKLALAAEAYDRSKKGQAFLGGLHDYIDTLNKDQIYDIIMQYVNRYPELRRTGMLESLAKLPKEGFDKMLQDTQEKDLKVMCLALEKYDRKVRNIVLMGGLHDYIDTLNKDDLVGYIRKMADSYPKIRDRAYLDKIVRENSI